MTTDKKQQIAAVALLYQEVENPKLKQKVKSVIVDGRGSDKDIKLRAEVYCLNNFTKELTGFELVAWQISHPSGYFVPVS